MTTEEFLALPDNDDVERWLLRGKLVERPKILHSYSHSRTEAQIVYLLMDWLERQPIPRGVVVSGEAGFWLSRSPDSAVGIDVAYLSPELTAATPENSFLIDGPPMLAVEILSL